MITTAEYARENKIPFLGICLGLQCAVIDYARHVSKLDNANSTEFNKKTPYPVIDLMFKQKKINNKREYLQFFRKYKIQDVVKQRQVILEQID